MYTFRNPIKVVKILIVAFLLATLFGCGDDDKKTLQDAPSDVAALYKARCLNCHGSELQGRVGPNTSLIDIGNRMTLEDITKQIQEGENLVMPAFKDSLTQEEITSLAEWLASLK
ncbi:cytochrome c [Paenibacillus sp. GSMTC-2017]|uniref:c-type cytochrome n=1 Tax=Paenibacillus sp. GSMTC-2017 TaxID=2794350 RepID=UPI0018D7E902|nr:cytochrome c [Paenibacillus sp. GSMTC-2017]